MTLDEYLKQVSERAENSLSMGSDDFNHDCQALLEWESKELQHWLEIDIPKLLQIISVMREALKYCANCVPGPEQELEIAVEAIIEMENDSYDCVHDSRAREVISDLEKIVSEN